MHHITLAAPMGKRDVDHVNGLAEQHAELTDSLSVRPIATADEQRARVQPDHVAAFEQTGRFDPPGDAEPRIERLEGAPLRLRFGLACGLAHPAQNQTVRTDDRRIARVG